MAELNRAGFDVAVIGAGVVGSAIARALAHFRLRVALLEAGADVGAGTSKASTAILHTGFDATPGTLEAKLVRRGSALLDAYAREVGIAVEHTGALLVAWNDEQERALPEIAAKAARNGVTDVRPVPVDELYGREPQLAGGALAALFIPGEAIVCPYTPTLALATEAVLNGVVLQLRARVAGVTAVHASSTTDADAVARSAAPVSTPPPAHRLRLENGSEVTARFVVNAAGLGADGIERFFGRERFTVRPRRGELIVFDKAARTLLSHVLLPVPTGRTKGVLVAPTVFGNVLLGPTADDIDDRSDAATTRAGLSSLVEKGRAILPALLDEEVTATYAGLRAATEHADYQIFLDRELGYVCVGGIRSTGVSASLGIAEHVVGLLDDAGLALERRADDEIARVQMPPIGEAQQRAFASSARIAVDPDYGRIVCHCERVTRGELRDATRGPLPARTLDGMRRRTRCLQGRCQGFHCLAEIVALLARSTGASPADVLALAERGDERASIRSHPWSTSTS